MLQYNEYGLEQVPTEKRILSAWHLGLIWAGISFCLPTFMIGAMPVPGLSWEEALSANIIGNLVCMLLIALSGYAGIKHGLPTVALCKAYFGGVVGGLVIPVLLVISTVGWFGLMLAATVDGIIEVASLGASDRTILTIILGFCMTATAALGNRVILSLDRYSVPLLVFMTIYFLYMFLTWMPAVSTEYIPTGEIGYYTVINLIISGYIVGAICASDFSRYAPNQRVNWIGTFFGVFIVSLLLSFIAMYAKLITGEWNPLKATFIAGFGHIVFFIIVFSSWTTNQALIYSAGIALSSVVRGTRLVTWTTVAGVLGTIVAFSDIVQNLENFLTMLAYVFPGVLGVLLCHLFVIDRFYSQLDEKTKAVAFGFSVLCSVIVQFSLKDAPLLTMIGMFTASIGYALYLLFWHFTKRNYQTTNSAKLNNGDPLK